MIVPIKSLYEAHLTVRDLDRSVAFYRDVLGLPLATVIPARNVAFFWVPKPETAMLGIWAVGTAPMSMKLHIAFTVDLPDVQRSVGALREAGITPHFNGTEIDEPIVLPWMPATSVYFDDPDGHALEFIALLPDRPRPDLSMMPLSKWQSLEG